MDLSFVKRQLKQPRPLVAPAVSVMPADLSDLIDRMAVRQAASVTAHSLALAVAEERGRDDHVLGLARLMAPRRFGPSTASCLAGSFNPLIARQLTVGQMK